MAWASMLGLERCVCFSLGLQVLFKVRNEICESQHLSETF